MAIGDIWFRIEDHRVGTGYVDVYGDYVSTGTEGRARLRYFRVERETPKGVWLRQIYGETYEPDDFISSDRPRFVLRESNKRYACPTKEEALASFEARKRKHTHILATRIDLINESVRLARAGQFG